MEIRISKHISVIDGYDEEMGMEYSTILQDGIEIGYIPSYIVSPSEIQKMTSIERKNLISSYGNY